MEHDETRPLGKGDRLAAVVRWSDRLVLWLLAMPAVVIAPFVVNGPLYGLAIGLALGIGVWVVWLGIKTTVLVIGVRSYNRLQLDQDLIAICEQAYDNGDHNWAIAQLQDLLTRSGESFDRLLSLAEYLRLTKQAELAMSVNSRAIDLGSASDLWRAELGRAECLLDMGRKEEAYALSSRLVQQIPHSFNAHLTHARAAAEMGDFETAETSLQHARRLSSSITVRLSAGRIYTAMMRKDMQRAEERVARCRMQRET